MPTAPRGFDFKLRRQVMTIRKLAFALAFGSVLFVGGSSLATQGSGVTPTYKVVSSNADIFVQAIGNRLKLRFGSKKAPINVLNVHQVFAPGAFFFLMIRSPPRSTLFPYTTPTSP